jgi:hypothetical protein
MRLPLGFVWRPEVEFLATSFLLCSRSREFRLLSLDLEGGATEGGARAREFRDSQGASKPALGALCRPVPVPSGVYQWVFAIIIGSADSPPPQCPPGRPGFLSAERGRAAWHSQLALPRGGRAPASTHRQPAPAQVIPKAM